MAKSTAGCLLRYLLTLPQLPPAANCSTAHPQVPSADRRLVKARAGQGAEAATFSIRVPFLQLGFGDVVKLVGEQANLGNGLSVQPRHWHGLRATIGLALSSFHLRPTNSR